MSPSDLYNLLRVYFDTTGQNTSVVHVGRHVAETLRSAGHPVEEWEPGKFRVDVETIACPTCGRTGPLTWRTQPHMGACGTCGRTP